MPTTVCPLCKSTVRIKEEHYGKKVGCSNCGAAIQVAAQPSALVLTPIAPSPGLPPAPFEPRPSPQVKSPPSIFSSPIGYLVLSWLAGLLAVPAALGMHRSLGLALAISGALFALVACVCSARWAQGGTFATSLASIAISASALVVLFILRHPVAAKEGGRDDPGGGEPDASWSVPNASKYPSIGSVLATYPGHIVILPTQGTFPENVDAILKKELFSPERVTMIRRDPAQREAMLHQQLDRSIKGIPEGAKLWDLLVALRGKEVRFKGYLADDQKQSLTGLIQRGGVFTCTTPAEGTALPTQRHGSLLHSDGIKHILEHAGMSEDQPRSLLQGLRDAVRDYASLNDALAIIGNRLAFLITVDPNAAAHDAAVKKLLTWSKPPVFVPRPPPRLFDAVDPREETGTGSASYTLKLPRPCYWRQVSMEDRIGIDRAETRFSERMKWKEYKPDEVITWKPFSITRTDGRSVPVSSYDIAVVLPERVVVFRNQNLFVGDSREAVEKQAKTYVRKRLLIPIQPTDEIVNVAKPEKQFVGTLLYSSLADLVLDKADARYGSDLELPKRAAFQTTIKHDDALTK